MIDDGHRHIHILIRQCPLDAQMPRRFELDLVGRLQISTSK
jgi:hypothetical protein